MADRPKKKPASGARNDERKNGKAPKKHVKQPKFMDPEKRKALQDRKAAERRVKEAEVARRRQHALARMQTEALKMNADFDRQKRANQHNAVVALRRQVEKHSTIPVYGERPSGGFA